MRNSKRSEIRFPGFTVEWNQCKLEDVADRMKSYSLSRDVETADDTGYKYIHYGDIHTKVADIIDENSELPNIKVGNYELLQKNDVVVADASEDYQGIATPAVVTYTPEFNLVSGLHTIALRPKKTVAIYLYYLLNTQIFKKYGYKVGTGMKVFGISSTNLMKFEARYPSLDEQEQIGNFLKQLDDTIALYQNELDVLKKTKKGFLQKMFPKVGELVPEIRFPRFSDDWAQRKLSDLITLVIREIPKPSKPYKKISVRSHAKGTFHRIVDDPAMVSMEKLYVVKENDLIVNITFAWEHAIAIANRSDDGLLVSHRFPTFVIDKSDIDFINYSVTQESFRRKMELISPGGAGRNRVLNRNDFLNLKISVPNSINEQREIGMLLSKLDNLIILQQRELELLRETKKAFLQKMFINT